MATRSNVNTTKDEFAMPEEFDGDEVAVGTANGTAMPTSSGATVPLSQLNTGSFDDDRDEVERAKLNNPTGDWEKDDRWEAKEPFIINTDSQPDDFGLRCNPPYEGRTFFNVSGKPKGRSVNGIDYNPMLFVRVSPDRRYKQDKPTEVDMAYKLFMKAKDLYLELKGERVSNAQQLIDMLTEDAYIVRTMNGDNGPVVVDIKAKRQQQRR